MTDTDAERGRARAKDVSLGATPRSAPLAPASSIQDFRADPVGRWVGGGSFVYAWPTPTLCATVLFGEPSREDLEALGVLFATELSPPAVPHGALIDARRIARVEPTAYAAMSEYVETRRDAMRGMVTQLALVRPGGLIGAVTAGFYETHEPPYPVSIFAAPEEALAWLGADPGWAAALDALIEEDLSPLLRDVRRAILTDLAGASPDAVAAALGLAVRTLQRRLKGEGTTFRAELAAVQIRAAERWLRETDAPVSRIAYELGFSTPQQLSHAFRQATGETPTAWRAARRARPLDPPE